LRWGTLHRNPGLGLRYVRRCFGIPAGRYAHGQTMRAVLGGGPTVEDSRIEYLLFAGWVGYWISEKYGAVLGPGHGIVGKGGTPSRERALRRGGGIQSSSRLGAGPSCKRPPLPIMHWETRDPFGAAFPTRLSWPASGKCGGIYFPTGRPMAGLRKLDLEIEAK